jgi:hypothetical protein
LYHYLINPQYRHIHSVMNYCLDLIETNSLFICFEMNFEFEFFLSEYSAMCRYFDHSIDFPFMENKQHLHSRSSRLT